ncbi:NUDIX hydrolase [Treponema rectale]|uniref:GDP-mannose pyrophosphatase n=1 Tax=Treponema rectale TaxID=744512 RepID=A0A840SEC6_9SPIR|nr:NUDIX hydrolase [Treponema rectale]MBB5217791.1 8-oxo-dGTP pyrophosphatase MutT (NUDIX family) [Treponema rectale]QOS40482.1 NUDIX hydrolase [Treponema rectale]
MQNTNEPPIKQLTHELKYENKWMKVYEDKILRSSGKEGLYGVVEKGEFALIVPFDGKYLYLVEQYRYPLKVKTLEFPQGMLEKSDTGLTEGARRELKEETGLSAGFIQEAGTFFTAVGFSDQTGHVFYATELSQGNQHLDEEEEDLKIKTVTPSDFETLIKANMIKDSGTLSAYAMLKSRGIL